LRLLLVAVLMLFALLTINSIYLGAVTFIEWLSSSVIQNYFYQWMFLGHLLLGLLLIVPAIVYGLIHIRNAHDHRNRRAVKAGYALFILTLVLLASGLALTRGLPWVELKNPDARSWAYWMHVATPLLVVWLFVLHRLAGKRIRWRTGGMVAGIAAALSLVAIIAQSQDPRRWNQQGPDSGEQYFHPSLARTTDGQFIDADALMMDSYCQECHADVHERWAQSMHRFSSFNNPAYLFAVSNTRDLLQQRDGSIQGVRFCAGCHDPVPFFSGAMDHPDFGDTSDPIATAGITCSVCHSITNVNSPRGNADYTIEAPLHYPFARSERPWLQWINQTLVKAKPEFHNKTFLKPLHESSEFCGACHKVHLPQELNAYKWLRGQNHYDSFLLSGVSGHGVQSFYYPQQAETNCNGCHMEALPSDDFGARQIGDEPGLQVHDHQFPSANTAIPHMLGMPGWVNERHTEMLQDSLRVDIFGIREAGRIDGALHAPLPSDELVLQPGKQYLVEVVIRTLELGHHFTQGTSDSNEVWLHVEVDDGVTTIATSGELQAPDKDVDAWAHFVNAYVIDRDGQRIEMRDPENIFTQLYDNQIPPGAADVVHYRLDVPEDQQGPVDISVSLKYRKFDTRFLRHFEGDEFDGNDLPVTVIASDRLRLPVGTSDVQIEASDISEWQRWNDYGIGLFRREQFRQAEEAFAVVEMLGRGDGALNLARVYLREGRLTEAADALARAANAASPAPPWSISYFTAHLNLQNGYVDEAIAAFRDLVDTRFQDARDRGFDFSEDYRLLNDLALALAERAKFGRGEEGDHHRLEAVEVFWRALAIDPENATAHYGLAQLYEQLGSIEAAELHRELHAEYKVDDNARDRAVQLARRNDAAADHAANDIVIYELRRVGQ
jgi:tetratricopeptide (TPR) repeat protein